MPYPTDVYQGDTAIYGGMNPPSIVVPSWVPAIGTIADISLNTLQSARGTIPDNDVKQFTRTWSGVAYARSWGVYGRLVGGGGGHGDGDLNCMFNYDVESRLWALEKNAAPVYPWPGDPEGASNVADTLTGWMYANTSGTALQVGEPFTSHFYAYQVALPPSAIAGSAPNGWLFTPGRTSLPPASDMTAQSHKWALGQGVNGKWTMHGTPLARGPLHGLAIHDTKRNRVISITQGANAGVTKIHMYIDLITEAVGTLTFSASVDGNYAIGGYASADDCYVTARYMTSGTLKLQVLDPVTLIAYFPTPSGTKPEEVGEEGAWEWIDSKKMWVYIPGTSSNNVYFLKCVGNPRLSASWSWHKTVISGTVRPAIFGTQGGGTPYNRLRYCEPLDMMIWYPDYAVPVQGFRTTFP